MTKRNPYKAEITTKLKGVHNTTLMVKKFSTLIQGKESDEVYKYLEAFKETYSSTLASSTYSAVKESILDQVELLGIERDYAKDHL